MSKIIEKRVKSHSAGSLVSTRGLARSSASPLRGDEGTRTHV